MADQGPKKGGVNWVELSKVVAMPLVTLVVAAIFNNALNDRQARDNHLRSYADMLGRREEADSALRKDMFKSILDTFLQHRDPKQPAAQYLETDVLNIELLAYNFHESLDLGPLFKHVRQELIGEKEITDTKLLFRLEKAANEVKSRQLTVIAESGMVVDGQLDLEKASGNSGSDDRAWDFGPGALVSGRGQRRMGPTLCMSTQAAGARHFRQFKVGFIDFQKNERELDLQVTASRPLPEAQCRSLAEPEAERKDTEAHRTFSVGPFSFPMIDNIQLSHGERFAVLVMAIGPDFAEVKLAYYRDTQITLKGLLDGLLHNKDTFGAGPQ